MSEPTQGELDLRAKISILEDRIFTLLEKGTAKLPIAIPYEALMVLRDAVQARREAIEMLSKQVAIRLKADHEWVKERYGDKPYH